ncbi:MAG TPA: methylated-DNA--[protein]-cysteine S-methyltransferase [Actinomycetota bacterium]|nr:methylated-DNA--[protein]-cysteine S-methyltransferase [Actinomycetota bacterium]
MKDIEHALKAGPGVGTMDGDALRLAAQGAGLLDVAYTITDSPFGPILLAATDKGLVRLAYPNERDPLDEVAANVSPRILEDARRLDDARRQLDDYFEGRRPGFDLPVDWAMTKGFQRRVLRATHRIPFGAVSTYREVAKRAGNDRAARAAGNALGSNPIPIVVPCHRVLHSGGGLGGYTGGLDRKRFLLRLEGVL